MDQNYYICNGSSEVNSEDVVLLDEVDVFAENKDEKGINSTTESYALQKQLWEGFPRDGGHQIFSLMSPTYGVLSSTRRKPLWHHQAFVTAIKSN
ncbi:hypothetical protein TNCT_482551 [Trichonephila clavata]|uniref:Uncharacterized protein n=1 Tax=Trichonephila clavata TaxID=2740835 RepID=A0A8X6M4B5_TRICU|nr:hypothetical protein TNCT_482551 [Trichonephila clavata]